MPITRRRRVNPPEQPENNTTPAVEQQPQTEATEKGAAEPKVEQKSEPVQVQQPAPEMKEQESSAQATSPSASAPQPTEQTTAPAQSVSVAPTQTSPIVNPERSESVTEAPRVEVQRAETPRVEHQRPERISRIERNNHHSEYAPSIEGGRRTSRGELFRRPPQPPVQQQPMPTPTVAAPLQAPTHEISLPLGNLLHLAYNPGYTGSDEARSAFLQKLANECKSGGRARCWSCGSLAIVYDRWNTRSKTFGEVGVAYCEICGVWSVM